MTNDPTAAALADYRKTFDTPISRVINRMWGGHWHLGVFDSPNESLHEAQMRANLYMANGAGLRLGHKVAEVACGVGGTSRFLAREYGVTVWATNVAEAQIDEARELTQAEGLSDRIEYSIEDFHELSADPATFDCWWCQEALLYAVDKQQVIREGLRIVKPGGALVLSDLLLEQELPVQEREKFTTAMKAPYMSSRDELDAIVKEMGLNIIERRDWSEYTVPTYDKLLTALNTLVVDPAIDVDREALTTLTYRVTQQFELARAGHLGWLYYAIRR